MKRTGNLFKEFCSFDNLYLATKLAQKGKRYKCATAKFNFQLEKNIVNIREKLLAGKYRFSQHYSFVVYTPKKRLISAAPYQDRVVHHAMCNILNSIFEPMFIYDLYSNRKNKGTHKAVQQYKKFCRYHQYVLKCDIKKYFPSINKAILFNLIKKKIKDNDFLEIIKQVIFNFEAGSECGLPLGNLTSQLFGNLYLNGLDHFIKEKLKCHAYIRYVDDYVLFDHQKAHLHYLKQEIETFLVAYKLELHPQKSQVRQVSEGIKFLGYRIYPNYVLVNKENVQRFKQKLKRFQQLYKADQITLQKIIQSMLSWNAHATWANSYLIRKRLFDYYVFSKG